MAGTTSSATPASPRRAELPDRPRRPGRAAHVRAGRTARRGGRAAGGALPRRARGSPAGPHGVRAGRRVHGRHGAGLGPAGGGAARRARRQVRDGGRGRRHHPAGQGQAGRRAGRGPADRLRGRVRRAQGAFSDADEDEHVRTAAHALAEAQQDGTAPPFAGIRIKSFEAPTRARGVRTLTRFLATYAESRGSLDGFVVTLPKVTSTEQVGAFVHAASTIEDELGLADASVRFEVQVETPQSVLGPDGTALVARMVHAADGRLTGLHYGTYDYSAFCGIAAGQQSLEHPVADHAKLVMQAAAAGTGVRLSDGSTNVLPVGDGDAVHLAWAEPPPAGHPLAGARVLPGLGPPPGPPADAVRRDVRLLPWRPGPRARAAAGVRGAAAGGHGRRRARHRPGAGRLRAPRPGLRRGRRDRGARRLRARRRRPAPPRTSLESLGSAHGGVGREPVRQGGEPGRADRARGRPPRDPRPQRQHLAARRLRRRPRRPATSRPCCRRTPRRTPRSPTPSSTASPRPRTTRWPSAGGCSRPRRRRPRRRYASSSTPGTGSAGTPSRGAAVRCARVSSRSAARPSR